MDEYANVEIYREKGYRIKAIRIVCSTITGMPVGYRDYALSEQPNCLEFHIKEISRLKKLDMEIGLASYVVEARGDEQVLRELKLDVTTPQSFRLSTDA